PPPRPPDPGPLPRPTNHPHGPGTPGRPPTHLRQQQGLVVRASLAFRSAVRAAGARSPRDLTFRSSSRAPHPTRRAHGDESQAGTAPPGAEEARTEPQLAQSLAGARCRRFPADPVPLPAARGREPTELTSKSHPPPPLAGCGAER